MVDLLLATYINQLTYVTICTGCRVRSYNIMSLSAEVLHNSASVIKHPTWYSVCLIYAFVTWSDKTGITYFEVNFKYSVCSYMYTNFSHILHIFLTFKTIYCTSSEQQSFLPFKIVFYLVLTLSGELQ